MAPPMAMAAERLIAQKDGPASGARILSEGACMRGQLGGTRCHATALRVHEDRTRSGGMHIDSAGGRLVGTGWPMARTVCKFEGSSDDRRDRVAYGKGKGGVQVRGLFS